jgi:acyl-coenzyme A thioesterase PaaI-like protein
MSLAVIDQALRAVPYVANLGIRVEEARPGHIVLRIPYGKAVTNHAGALSTGAIFSVGELAASVVLATHPTLGKLISLQKSSRVKYFVPATKDVTAHATVTAEMVQAVEEGLGSGTARVDVPVKVLDGHGTDVAELLCSFTFRAR